MNEHELRELSTTLGIPVSSEDKKFLPAAPRPSEGVSEAHNPPAPYKSQVITAGTSSKTHYNLPRYRSNRRLDYSQPGASQFNTLNEALSAYEMAGNTVDQSTRDWYRHTKVADFIDQYIQNSLNPMPTTNESKKVARKILMDMIERYDPEYRTYLHLYNPSIDNFLSNPEDFNYLLQRSQP